MNNFFRKAFSQRGASKGLHGLRRIIDDESLTPPPLETKANSPPPNLTNYANTKLLKLPLDIWRYIFCLNALSPLDVYIFRCTSKAARHIVETTDPNIDSKCERKLYIHASSVSVAFMRWLEDDQLIRYPEHRHLQLVTSAAASNKMENLIWLLTRKAVDIQRPLSAAIGNGHLSIVKYFESHYPSDFVACGGISQLEAAKHNQRRILSYIRSRYPPEDILHAAAREGHLQLVKEELELPCTRVPMIQVSAAAASGILELVIYIHQFYQKRNEWSPQCLDFGLKGAIGTGKLAVIDYFLSIGARLSPAHAPIAAKAGQLETLKFIVSKMEILPDSCIDCGVMCGKVEVVRYVWNLGPISDKQAISLCDIAASKNHVEILAFLRTVGCPWTFKTAICAARNENIDSLRYCMENGCPIPKDGHDQLMFAAAGQRDMGTRIELAPPNLKGINYLHEKFGAPITIPALWAAVMARSRLHLKFYIREVLREARISSKDLSQMIITYAVHFPEDMLDQLRTLKCYLKVSEQQQRRKYTK